MSGCSTIIYKLVSSANNLMWEIISETISFINTKNSSGQSIEPCGTPACMTVQFDCAPGMTTRCFLSLR